jgi:hypothetical protein
MFVSLWMFTSGIEVCYVLFLRQAYAKKKYGWESLLSELDNESSGPTLCVDFTDMEKWIGKEGRGA